jgi:hypothetical protein
VQTAGNRHANTCQPFYGPHALPVAVFSSGQPLFTTAATNLPTPERWEAWSTVLAPGIELPLFLLPPSPDSPPIPSLFSYPSPGLLISIVAIDSDTIERYFCIIAIIIADTFMRKYRYRYRLYFFGCIAIDYRRYFGVSLSIISDTRKSR